MNFPHITPPGYEYWQEEFNSTLTRIWLKNIGTEFTYRQTPPSTIWGFYDNKKKCFISPINHKKPGKVVDIKHTSPYTAMVSNLTPLELAFL